MPCNRRKQAALNAGDSTLGKRKPIQASSTSKLEMGVRTPVTTSLKKEVTASMEGTVSGTHKRDEGNLHTA